MQEKQPAEPKLARVTRRKRYSVLAERVADRIMPSLHPEIHAEAWGRHDPLSCSACASWTIIASELDAQFRLVR